MCGETWFSSHVSMIEFHAGGQFYLVLVLFLTALPGSGGLSLENVGMLLHDAVWVNCKRSSTTVRIQVPRIWAIGRMLGDCA